ncbi:MAG: ABC transporter ATP-binding protein [Clostridia bacterium]|nr:ABC transporter ATP-binding protein [Clostridia bacterium]
MSKQKSETGRWIFKRIRAFMPYILMLVVFVVVISYINVQFSLVSKSLIDIATNQAEGSLKTSVIKLVVLLVSQLLLQILYIRIHVAVSGKLAMAIRTELFYKLLSKDYNEVSKIHSGEVLNRLVSDVSLISEKVTEIIPNVFALCSTILFSFITLYQLDSRFALFCLCFGPVVLLAAYIYKKKIKNLHLKCRESDGRVRSHLQETIQNFIVVKAFRKENLMKKNSQKLQYENYRLNVKRSTVGILSNVLFFVAMTVGYYAALAWGVYRLSIGDPTFTFGTLTAILALVGQIQSPFREIASVLPQIYMVLASTERLIEIDNLPDDCEGRVISDKEAHSFTELTFNDVDFSYGEVEVLKGVTFTVKKGEFVALCGVSGAGKSTLSKVMLSVVKPDAGRAYIVANGEKLDFCAQTRKLFSYVPQGNMILSGTIRDNITFCDENPNIDKIISAATAAQIIDDINKMPEGFDTVLGEKGHGLSEGQVQRLAIARALYYDAPVLLLDEATSSLDIATEDRLLTAIKEMTDKTCIIISHRREVMQACDKTYILQNGSLNELNNIPPRTIIDPIQE